MSKHSLKEPDIFRTENFHYLDVFIHKYKSAPVTNKIKNKLNNLKSETGNVSARPAEILSLYQLATDHLTTEFQTNQEPIELQKSLFAEMEFLLSRFSSDPRHSFIIVIPVAERPRMLENSLQSLVRHCHAFNYGGLAPHIDHGMAFRKVRVMVVDDSRNFGNIEANKKIVDRVSREGIPCRYVSLKEQGRLIADLEDKTGRSLHRIVGTCSSSGSAPSHKGASITRNIAYLSIANELTKETEKKNKTLIFFLDSDEEFSIRIKNELGRFETDLISYFHTIDRLFREHEIDLLTGKVVGDPPVSPAVMVNNLLEDLLLFFKTCSGLTAESPCVFHQAEKYTGGAAQYNDMLHLFGYRRHGKPAAYPCPCSGSHSVSDGFRAFASRVNGFFHGLHPTREILFKTTESVNNTVPARTVYTGNYVFRPTMLDYFIPFADLKLRMAGPVLGRILKHRIGERFVSANIPLLHKRTIGEKYQSEFRHGVDQAEDTDTVNLSVELEKQFWGDVMLFTIEALIDLGFPDSPVKARDIKDTLVQTRNDLWSEYKERRLNITANADKLMDFLEDNKHWWNKNENFLQATNSFRKFICSVRENFITGSSGQKILESKIKSSSNPGGLLTELAVAIEAYHDDETAWKLLTPGANFPLNLDAAEPPAERSAEAVNS